MKTQILCILLILPAPLVAQENARIIEHSTFYTLDEGGNAEISESYKIRINSEQGKDFALYYDYFDKFRKIADVTIDILTEDGKRVKRLRRVDGVETGFNASYEITDAKVLVIEPKYQDYPFVLQVTSLVKLNGYLSLPTWLPQHQFHLAVDNSVLTITRPETVSIRIREENIKGSTSKHGGKLISVYQVSNLPAVENKIRYTDFYDAAPKVLVSPDQFSYGNTEGSFTSWREFGDWFVELNDEPYELTTATMQFIDGLDKTNKAELIRKIYEYMQDKTRYVSIQMGIGGFKSLPTRDVEKYGYGDCKALTTYLKNMLNYAGTNSNYILVRAGRDVPDVLSDFPSNQFNHVFLGIPMQADTMMIECTSQTSPTGYTGTFTDDRNVLWIDKSNSKVIRSRIYTHDENKKKSSVKINMNIDGTAKVTFNVESEGVFFDEIMIYNSAPADYVKDYNHMVFPYEDYAIKDFSFKQPERQSPTFSTNFVLQVNSLAKLTGQRLIMSNVPTIPLNQYLRFDDLGKFCSIKRGLTVIDDIEVVMPDGYWIYNLPASENITSRFGEYKLSTEFDGQILRIKRSFILYKGDYTKEEFDQFRAFHQKLEKLETRKLVMNSKT